MRLLVAVLAFAAAGCARGCHRTAGPDASGDDSDDATVPAGDAATVRSACVRVGSTPLAGVGDAGFEAASTLEHPGGVTVLWSAGDAVGLWRSGRPAHSVQRGGGERSDPVGAIAADGTPGIAWVQDRLAGREHVLRCGMTLGAGCTGPEGRDEGLSLSLANAGNSWILAWDEDGPAPAAGSVHVQVATAVDGGVRCGATRTISPAPQDAEDPLAITLGDGRAAVLWLTARDVDATESNDTATDVWGVVVGATGAPVGAPLRITHTVDHHFGLSARAAGDALWVAMRAGGPSDSEGRGDGGDVRVVRVDVGPPGLLRVGDAATLTEASANPTGAPRVTAPVQPGSAAEVWWRERVGERVETHHRAVSPACVAMTEGCTEPTLDGALPGVVDRSGVATAVVAASGGPALVRWRCAPHDR